MFSREAIEPPDHFQRTRFSFASLMKSSIDLIGDRP